ncbi:MAG: serine/threonine protein phosphatase, partial [Firmicutes bacterium]|nr:serine/threonine protein phosphatase [Bacillota bacterium]
MNVYSIGDLHLSFSVGPDKSMDRFGGVWINHAQRLKDNWEKTVADDDLVIMPGDFSWALKLS